jgi:hypothetical protein
MIKKSYPRFVIVRVYEHKGETTFYFSETDYIKEIVKLCNNLRFGHD